MIYDPDKITYEKLLDIYWHHIDPLTPNQAFCDAAPSIARSFSIATPRRSGRRKHRSGHWMSRTVFQRRS